MSNSKNQTKSFDKRAGTTDKGREYEDVVTALLALKLVRNRDVENFQLSSNRDKYGALDDIVLEVNYKSQDTKNFAIQVKHKEKHGKQITRDMLAAGIKGDFSLQKYIESFKKIKANGNQDNFKCILYTNVTFEYSGQFNFKLKGKEYIQVSIKKHTLSADDFLNTSDNDYVYQFEINQNLANNSNEAEMKEYADFFKHFFFYPNQKNLEKINESTQQFFLEECHCEIDSFRFYKDFINSWSKLEGKKNSLNRKIINLKIGECLLKPSSVKIEISTKSHPIFHPLQEAFLHFDVTVVQTSDNLVKDKIKEFFAEIHEPDINEVSRVAKTFCVTSKAISSIEEFNRLDSQQKATILWYMDKLPLIIQVDQGKENILKQAEEFCQQDGEKKKFIFIGKDIKRSDFKNLQVFENLQDLSNNSDIFENIAEKIEISLQGRDDSLKNVIRDHPGIAEKFSTVELINSSDKALKIGEKKEKLPRPYIEQSLSKYVTDFKFFTENNTGSLSVINCNNKLEVVKKQMTGIKIVKVEDFLKDRDNDSENYDSSTDVKRLEKRYGPLQKVVVVAENKCLKDDFEKICTKSNKTCHLFYVNSTNSLEWITSHGSPQELRKYQKLQVSTKVSSYIQESEIFNSSVQKVNIITAKPGMGKSVMLQYLKNNIPRNLWVVYINFREHVRFFAEMHDVSQVIKYFLDDQAKRMQYDEFAKNVRRVFESKSKIVFLWDGLDELPSANVKNAMEVIEDLSDEGFLNWITARDYLQTTLEDKFDTFASTIKIMDEDQQKLYINDRLTSKYNQKEIEDITEKIMKTIAKTGDLGFLGIPLHISILTELFREHAKKYSNLLESAYTLSDMLEDSVKEKFNFCYKERGDCKMEKPLQVKILEDYRQDRISQYEKLALKFYLPKYFIDKLNVNCEKLLTDIKSSKDDFGIVTRVDDEGTATFCHNIYGEYFVANWMANNPDLMPQFKDFFFEEAYNNIRLIFDVILAKGRPAHLAVLYKDYANLQERSEEEINQKDKKGRSPLHLACSWGEKRPVLPVKKEEDSFVIDDTAAQVAKEDSSEYVKILSFLLSTAKCNPFEKETLFKWHSIEYADSSLSLSAIEVISKNCNLDLKTLQKFSDNCNILYYGIKFGYTTLLEKIENVPYIEVEVNRNNLLHEAIIYKRNDFLKKILDTHAFSRRINKKNCEKRPTYIEAALPLLLPTADEKIMERIRSNLEINPAEIKNLEQAPLHTASVNGNMEAMEILLPRADDILDNCLNNALHLAVMHEHMEIVEMLIRRGFKKDDVNLFRQNILHMAAKTGNWELTNYILELGVTFNSDDVFLLKPTGYAVLYNHPEIMELILQKMPSMMKKDHMIYLLNFAVFLGQVDIVNSLFAQDPRLIENIADVKEPFYRISLIFAIMLRELEIAKILIQRGEHHLNNKDFRGCTPLHRAAQFGIEEIVKLLLEKGVKLDESNDWKMTPLHEATNNKHLNVVKLLVEKGASCNKTDQEGMTPLLTSLRNGHKEAAEFFIRNSTRYGINIDIPDHTGLNPLLLSVFEEDLYMIELLLENEANVNNKDPDGCTSLHWAAGFGRKEIVQLLLEKGASCNTTDQAGMTPFFYSIRNGHKEIAELFIQNRAKYCINIDIQDNNGLNPLLLSVLKEDLYMIQLLLENEADITVRYNSGDSVIHKASVNVEVLKLLIQHRADVNVVSQFGATPLHIAIFNGKKECTKLLIENGAHVPLKHTLDFRWYIALSKL